MSTQFFYGYPYFTVPVSGSVVTSGQFGDLKAHAGKVSVGVFDAQTYGVATAAGNGKEYFVGVSSEHTEDFLTMQLSGMKNPYKGTQVFKGDDVVSFEFSLPQKPKNETWVLGYNGAPSSKSLKFESGKSYGIMIDLEGNPIFRVMGRSARYEIWISTEAGVDSDCTVGCEEGVDCVKYTNMFAEAINTHVELDKLGIKARVKTSTFTPPSDTIDVWRITLTDGCDGSGLAAVQAVVGTGAVVRVVEKVDCVTTYEVCKVGAPAAITPARDYKLVNCDSCAAGYTKIDAQDVWVIRRPLAGTEDLTSDAAKDTYADTVGTAYGVATDANKIFLGSDGSVAVVQISVPVGTAITALVADTVEKARTTEASCQSDTVPSAVNWTDVGNAYRTKRSLSITLARTNCDGVVSGSNRLAEVTAYVSQFSDYVSGSIAVSADTDNCADDYTIEQWSQGCQGVGCLSREVPVFRDFGGLDGNAFVPAKVADSPEAGVKCGIEIYGGYVDTKFGNCSFNPNDYFEMEPIRMNLTVLTDYNSRVLPGQIGQLPTALKTQEGQTGSQSGEYILREFIKSAAYRPFASWCSEPRLREALNVRLQEQVDRNAYYKLYYLTVLAKREQVDQKKELFESMFAIKETEVEKQKAFENAFLSALSKHGVVLKQRDI